MWRSPQKQHEYSRYVIFLLVVRQTSSEIYHFLVKFLDGTEIAKDKHTCNEHNTLFIGELHMQMLPWIYRSVL